MWLIDGPFDGKTSGDVEFKKTKLLKTGRTYPLGRRGKNPIQLIVNHPKVSAEHGSFVVGEHSTADVTDPSVVPSLSYFNPKNKAVHFIRGEERLSINPSAQHELYDGDVIAIITGVHLTVRWRRVCCLSPPTRGSQAVSFESCAALGIKVVPTTHSDITHHLSPILNLTPLISTSMLSAARLVRPDWLNELMRLGDLPQDGSIPAGFEYEFNPPSEAKFRPPFAPTLPPALKTFRTWEPDEERVGMFRGWRFLFVGEKGREIDGEMRDLVVRGEGSYDVFDVAGGRTRWEQALLRSKRKADGDGGRGLCIVADEKGMKAAVGDEWGDLEEVAKSFELRLVAPKQVLEAIAYIDTSRINSNISVGSDLVSSSSQLPDFVPNTHPDEPSIPPESGSQSANAGPSTRLRRRATPATPSSRAPSPLALPVPMDIPANVVQQDNTISRPRRPLTRRAKTDMNTILGVGDPSIIESQPSADAVAGPSVPDPSTTTIDIAPSSRSGRLKRRAGTGTDSIIADFTKAIEDQSRSQGPSTKRFKALFDEADPDRITSQDQQESGLVSGGNETLAYSETQTQSDQARGARSRSAATPLHAVPEEMEESQLVNVTKRKAGAVSDDDDTGEAISKRQAVEDVNGGPTSTKTSKPQSTAVTIAATVPAHKPPSTIRKQVPGAVGAAPGKPDTDTAFLKALASTKKGKRNEDEFDREFNKLRISKPDLRKDEQVKEWAVLEDFGDDGDLRGNFMVIVEMDVPRRDDRGIKRGGEGRFDWEGKPDFKKFRRKGTNHRRAVVELVLDEENDYGMGSGYWKGNSQSESHIQSQVEGSSHPQPTQSQNPMPRAARTKPPSKTRTQVQDPRGNKGRGLKVINSDDSGGEQQSAVRHKRKEARRSESEEALTTQTQKKRQGKGQKLFLSSEGEDDEAEVQDHDMEDIEDILAEEDESSTLQSSGQAKSGRRNGRVAGEAPKKKKAPAPILDDDSDSGITFRGFDGRKKGKNK